MVTKVQVERTALNDEYAQLRVKILTFYRHLPLVGRSADALAHRLPPHLGHWVIEGHSTAKGGWHQSHSERVLAVASELEPVVRRIEQLVKLRRAENVQRIIAQNNTSCARTTDRQQINPGEWPPRFK